MSIPESYRPVGGRITIFLPNWQEITQCKWTIHIVRKGHFIPFHSTPPLRVSPPKWEPYTNSLKREALISEVNSLLAKNAIVEVRDWLSPGFYSRLFVVPKRNGKLRPVLDL